MDLNFDVFTSKQLHVTSIYIHEHQAYITVYVYVYICLYALLGVFSLYYYVYICDFHAYRGSQGPTKMSCLRGVRSGSLGTGLHLEG